MPSRIIAGKLIHLTDDGLFLKDPHDWTTELAVEVAREEAIETLTETHWKIIEFCRQEGLAEGRAPALRIIVDRTGVPMKDLFTLFPKSPDKKVARISGLRMAKRCI